MRYFKDGQNQVHGFDETIESQLPLIENAITGGWEEITGSWPPPPTAEQFLSSCEAGIQIALDTFAQSWGYDSVLSAASYVNSSVDIFKREAAALIGWRDAVWLWANNIVQGVKSGQTQMPSSVELVVDAMPTPPTRPE